MVLSNSSMVSAVPGSAWFAGIPASGEGDDNASLTSEAMSIACNSTAGASLVGSGLLELNNCSLTDQSQCCSELDYSVDDGCSSSDGYTAENNLISYEPDHDRLLLSSNPHADDETIASEESSMFFNDSYFQKECTPPGNKQRSYLNDETIDSDESVLLFNDDTYFQKDSPPPRSHRYSNQQRQQQSAATFSSNTKEHYPQQQDENFPPSQQQRPKNYGNDNKEQYASPPLGKKKHKGAHRRRILHRVMQSFAHGRAKKKESTGLPPPSPTTKKYTNRFSKPRADSDDDSSDPSSEDISFASSAEKNTNEAYFALDDDDSGSNSDSAVRKLEGLERNSTISIWTQQGSPSFASLADIDETAKKEEWSNSEEANSIFYCGRDRFVTDSPANTTDPSTVSPRSLDPPSLENSIEQEQDEMDATEDWKPELSTLAQERNEMGATEDWKPELPTLTTPRTPGKINLGRKALSTDSELHSPDPKRFLFNANDYLGDTKDDACANEAMVEQDSAATPNRTIDAFFKEACCAVRLDESSRNDSDAKAMQGKSLQAVLDSYKKNSRMTPDTSAEIVSLSTSSLLKDCKKNLSKIPDEEFIAERKEAEGCKTQSAIPLLIASQASSLNVSPLSIPSRVSNTKIPQVSQDPSYTAGTSAALVAIPVEEYLVPSSPVHINMDVSDVPVGLDYRASSKELISKLNLGKEGRDAIQALQKLINAASESFDPNKCTRKPTRVPMFNIDGIEVPDYPTYVRQAMTIFERKQIQTQ